MHRKWLLQGWACNQARTSDADDIVMGFFFFRLLKGSFSQSLSCGEHVTLDRQGPPSGQNLKENVWNTRPAKLTENGYIRRKKREKTS